MLTLLVINNDDDDMTLIAFLGPDDLLFNIFGLICYVCRLFIVVNAVAQRLFAKIMLTCALYDLENRTFLDLTFLDFSCTVHILYRLH